MIPKSHVSADGDNSSLVNCFLKLSTQLRYAGYSLKRCQFLNQMLMVAVYTSKLCNMFLYYVFIISHNIPRFIVVC